MTISNSPNASTMNCWAAFRSASAKLVKPSKRPSRKPRPTAADRLPTAWVNWEVSQSSAPAGKITHENN